MQQRIAFMLRQGLWMMWVFSACYGLEGQQPIEFSGAFYPAASHHYTYSDGLPDHCLSEMLMDSLGRLQAVMCLKLPGMEDMSIFTFDGRRAYPSGLDLKYPHFELSAIPFHGDQFLGKARVRHPSGVKLVAFLFDPVTVETNILYQVDCSFNPEQNQGYLQDIAVSTYRDSVYILTYEKLQFKILRLDANAQPETVAESFISEINPYRSFGQMAITKSYIWIVRVNEIIRMDRVTRAFKRFQFADDFEELRPPLAVAGPGDTVWMQGPGFPLMIWDPQGQQLIKHPFWPSAWNSSDKVSETLSRDQMGNVLVSQYNQSRSAGQCILVTAQGQYFDYNAIIPFDRGYAEFFSADFTRDLIIRTDGFEFMDVVERRAIESIPAIRNVRAIDEINQTIYLFETKASSIGYLTNKKLNYVHGSFRAFMFDQEFSLDANGWLWGEAHPSVGSETILAFDPVKDRQKLYPVQIPIERMIRDSMGICYIASGGLMYSWREGEKKALPISGTIYTAGINDIVQDRNHKLWLAGEEGLMYLDPESGLCDTISLVQNGAVGAQRLLADQQGSIWVGTMGRGLFIYNPQRGQVNHLDRTKGLLNDNVVALLEDQEGMVWAGTYDGINIITADGNIVGKVTEADGLSENECQRWSQCKLADGRLAFGAINGVNIIDPVKFKSQYLGRRKPQIFLTNILSDNTEDHVKNTLLDAYKSGQPIVLPAQDRNLTLTYALSNYADPEQNVFSYKINLPGEDWKYIGAQNTLSLQSLQPGKYSITIRGTDGRGTWSDPPIIVQLDVKNFFYKQWWFYVLLSIPFITGGFVWVYRQRLARKELEQEVIRRTATITEQKAKLEELDHVKSQLYTNITHEFRTPLTVIMGMADQLYDKAADPAVKESVRVIERNSASLLNLVNQMLDLRKLESGTMPLHLVKDDLLRYLRFMVESFRSLANSKHIHFSFLTEEQQLDCDFDPEKLRQIIANLLSNAIKFTPAGGDVFLQLDRRVNQAGEQIVIKVRDTGIGIPADKLPFIFERFYQVDDSTTRRGEGTGIGLTVASGLAELMKGELTVVSHPGQGTTFTLVLPFTNNAEPAILDQYNMPATLVPSMDESDHMESFLPGSPSDDSPTVLIVEDNPDVVHYLTLCLQGQYRLEIAVNGVEGQDLAIESIPDLIISDVMMPLMDGFELCQTLKDDERTSHIPIILLTAKADMDSRLAGIQRGADAYLSKPFHKPELLIQIEQLILQRKKLQIRYQAAAFKTPATTADPDLIPEDKFYTKFRSLVLSSMADEQLDPNLLSGKIGLSRSQLHRKLKALTGKSTMEIVKDIRLSSAIELLQNKDLTIAEVGYAVGFKYPETFTRAFQETFGDTPSDWREKQGS